MAKKPIELVSIEIDGQPYQVPKHQYVLWSARDLGIDVPHFCAHPWLAPYGACRMCLAKVELGGKMMPKLQTTCSLLPAEGMKVIFNDPEVIQARREQLEFHLLNHPLECPVCDKGGECMLQDQTRDHGNFAGRFIEQKRIRPDQVMNAFIRLNYKRCIHCKRCVHFAQDVDGTHFLKFIERGAETYIESFADPEVAPRFSGNVIDMCPVGALTARNYRFVMGRPWEQELWPSVGSLDGVGANIWVKTRLGGIARIEPRQNPDVRHGMLDDVTRFSYECVEHPRRVVKAIVRGADGEAQLYRNQAERQVAELLKDVLEGQGTDSIGVIAGSKLNTEEYVALRRFCTHVLDTHYLHFGDELLGGKTPSPAQLACLTGGADFSTLINVSTALSIGCDLFEEAPLLGLRLDVGARRGQLKLLSLRSHRSDADRFAAVFTDYGYGNLLRMVRGLVNGLTGVGEAPRELSALVAELKYMKEDCAILFGNEVFRDELPNELLIALAGLRDAIAAANPEAQVYLNPVFPAVNTAGALLVNHLDSFAMCEGPACRPPAGSLAAVLDAAAQGKVQALLVIDSDPLSTYPDRELVRRALAAVPVIYAGPFANPTSEHSRFHLPLGTWAHREGTVLNMEWRLQKRAMPRLTDIAPSVLDIVNSLAGLLGQELIASDIPTLYARLASVLPAWSRAEYADFPAAGELLRLAPTVAENLPQPGPELPAEVKGTAGEPLVLVPKRFLYNDREEIYYSPVFDLVVKPFHAYLNPLDLKVYNLADGEPAVFKAGDRELVLEVRSAAWVRQGSVVMNDYNLTVPVGQLAGWEPVRVQAARSAAASGS